MAHSRKRTTAALIALVATGGVLSIGAVLSQLDVSASDGVGSLNAVQVRSSEPTTTLSTASDVSTTGVPQTIHVYLPGESIPAADSNQGASDEHSQGPSASPRGTVQSDPTARGEHEDESESGGNIDRGNHEDENNHSESEHEGGDDDD